MDLIALGSADGGVALLRWLSWQRVSGVAADGGDGSAPADAPFALRWSPDGASLVLLGAGGGAWLLSVGGEGPVRVQAAFAGGARGGCGPAWLVASCARAAIGGEEAGPEQGWEEEGGVEGEEAGEEGGGAAARCCHPAGLVHTPSLSFVFPQQLQCCFMIIEDWPPPLKPPWVHSGPSDCVGMEHQYEACDPRQVPACARPAEGLPLPPPPAATGLAVPQISQAVVLLRGL